MADDEAAQMFDRAFALHAPAVAIAPEENAHRPFLAELFSASSPLRGVLPDPVISQQAALRETAYCADYPAAMRRIVSVEGTAVGRIMVDWAIGDAAMLIDIAVVPAMQQKGIGTAMLRAYLEVADQRRQRTMLQVMPQSPAQELYARLGFVPVESLDFAPYLDMVREPRG